MSQAKKHLIISKNNLLAISLLLLVALNISCINQQAKADDNTQINVQVCHDTQRVPVINSTLPANNATITTANPTLSVITDWGLNLQVSLNGTQIFNQNIAYQSNVTTSIPLQNMLAMPATNQLTLTLRGGCPETTVTQNLTLNFNGNIFGFDKLITRDNSPALTGTTNNPNLDISVSINGNTYTAINNGDGTWTLPAGTIAPALSEGSYNVDITTTDPATGSSEHYTYPNGLVIDNTQPTVTIDSDNSDERSPTISGTVDDPEVEIKIQINGATHIAINNGDGTWTLPAGTIPELANGDYPITITAIDKAGNVTSFDTIFKIKAANNIGFIIMPNTGYLRIGYTNIPSWSLYLLFIIIIAIVVKAKHQLSKTK